jgi:hypothetical protein
VRAQRALAERAERPLNFDPATLKSAGRTGWHVDDYRQPLPLEPPGEPVLNGSFESAQQLMCDYAFADPAIVRAVFDPASGLANRNMLLQARFGPLRFFLGCRVGTITDETRAPSSGGQSASGAGATARSPDISNAARWTSPSGSGSTTAPSSSASMSSRAAHRWGNPLIRLGFRLVGRRQQVRFARRACERMGELVARELA